MFRGWLLGLDSAMLAVSEANRGLTTGDSARRPTREASWLAALDDFRNWLIREAA
jgi:hypothetical protein